MTVRTIEVYDNNFMTIASGSPSLTPGSAIINNSDTPNGTIFQFSGGSKVTLTLDDTSTNLDVLEDDDYADHTITDGAGLVATGMGVESESLIFVRALDEDGNQTGPTITITVFSQNNVTQDVWAFHSDTPLVAGTEYVKISGSNDGTASYTNIANQPVCYSMGTLIDTPNGPTAVEVLRPGDLIWTLDHGPAPIRWIRSDAQPLEAVGTDEKPVLIAAGALGPRLPVQDLIVSPQHRILVGGHHQLQSLFQTEAFAPAKSLTRLPGIRHMKGKENITWVHFACEQHEVVIANGCMSESLLLGPMAVNGLTAPERKSVIDIFGSRSTLGKALNGPPARECLTVGAVQRQLANSLEKKRKRVAKEIEQWDVDLAMEQQEVELMQNVKKTNTSGRKSAA